MRRSLAVLAVVAAAATTLPATAKPSDPIVMTASGGRQQGAVWWYTQSARDGHTCSILHADGTGRVPEPVAHDGGALTWRLLDARRPTAVSVRARTYLPPPALLPVDPRARNVAVSVHPVKRRGKVVQWEVVSEPVGVGDLGIDVHVRWKGACGGTDDSAARFRVTSGVGVGQ